MLVCYVGDLCPNLNPHQELSWNCISKTSSIKSLFDLSQAKEMNKYYLSFILLANFFFPANFWLIIIILDNNSRQKKNMDYNKLL